MKKRINDSEIEKAKLSNKIIVFLTALMLLVVISGFVLYIIYDKEVIKIDSKKPSKEVEEKSIFSDENSELHVDDTRIVNLFNIVKITANECDGYNIKDSILVDDISDECKFSLASNIYRDDIIVDDDLTYILEKDVKNAYELLFGYNSYESIEEIPFNSFYSLYFNDVKKEYFTDKKLEEVGTPLSSYERIISVSKKSNYLNIESVSLFYNSSLGVLCRDYNCDDVIEKNHTDDGSSYYDLYLEHNKDKLYHYNYSFKLDNSGFYRYVGFEKTYK